MSKWTILTFIFYITIFKFFYISSKNLQYIEDIFSNEELNVVCPDHCKDGLCDNITLKCDSCIDGFYSDQCTDQCPTINCLRCFQDSGKCEECKDNYKLINNFCCESYCNKCNNTGCIECSDFKKYGLNCNDCPQNCFYEEGGLDRKCDQNTGNCYLCVNGKWGKTCKKKCSNGCDLSILNCDMNTGKCICKKGYYGSKCDNECDPNCINCDNNTGICYQCIEGYYPVDKVCNPCPENCDGECPGGICLKCKKGFYGDICNETCSIYCVNNTCDKKDGLCDCINYFWRESHCTECINHFDLETKCTECIKHYDFDSKCTECVDFFDISKNCTECINYFDIQSECTKCLKHFDLKSKCTECINYFDKDTNCTECINYFDIQSECTKCINHFDKSSNCSECLNHYDKETKCTKCLNHFDLESECTKCLDFFDINKNCSECINHFDISTNCTKCLNHFNIQSKCTECLNNFDIETECSECLNHYDKDTNCTYCLNHFDLESKCIECLNHYDKETNCTKCLNHFDLDSECTKCLDFFDINKNCSECLNHFDIESNCTKCIKNYNESTECTTCINKYDLSDNCETCLDYYDIESLCQSCMENFDPETNCTSCLGNYDIENICLTCINHFTLESKCTNCSLGFYGLDCNETCFEGCDLSKGNCRMDDGYCNECILPYYGDKCEKKSEIANCTLVDKTSGECIHCNDTYYLKDKKCEPCSNNCTNSLCKDDTGECYECASLNNYGVQCEKTCSPFCGNVSEGERICNRTDGSCEGKCIEDGHFSDEQCVDCEDRYYSRSSGCKNQCSSNCIEDVCSKDDGHCERCKTGFWDKKCESGCDELCRDSCVQIGGRCDECIDRYYKDEESAYPGCSKCPENCLTCIKERCTKCESHKYGDSCQEICNEHCQDQECEIDGKCPCQSKYYGDKCSQECTGCTENGCDDYSGNCIDHYCEDKFYDPRKCNNTCGENCGGEGKCDLFTGECINCEGNKWGTNCEKDCPKDCAADERIDCCFAKGSKQKGINIDIIESSNNKNNLKEEQSQFLFFYINLGGFDLKILADFETNSPLVIFDDVNKPKKSDPDIYNISIETKYNSINSSYYIEGEALDDIYEYDGFSLLNEKSAKDRLILKNHKFDNFSFLICQEYKVEKEFDDAGKINGIVGLGLRNYFTENLFYSNDTDILPKNILIKLMDQNKKKSIYIGDYNENIRNSFSKLSTMMIDNNKSIVMNKLITFETSFTGIAYSLRKAYQYDYDKKVILNNRMETTIVFNNLYKQFFEKIYFGDLFDNGCYFRSLQGGEIEYYCDINKKQAIQSLPKLGLILGNYIYYLSYDFLYKESGQFITFVIKLHGQSQQKIELGKSFFNEFSVVYNNGNETLNFFGEIKKLNVPLKDPSSILNMDSDLFTPGGWVTIVVFVTAVLIIICYLSKYCFNKSEKDENEEEEDDDDELLIDDTLE